MANFENTPAELGNALNGEATGPVRDEEKFKQAREAGWVAPQAYNYETAQAKHGDPAPSSSVEQVDTEEVAGWMHKAVKYEWQEEYGDVGPEVPELEKQLFGGDTRTKTGQFLDK